MTNNRKRLGPWCSALLNAPLSRGQTLMTLTKAVIAVEDVEYRGTWFRDERIHKFTLWVN